MDSVFFINVLDCKKGMIISKDVVLNSGQVIAAKDTPISYNIVSLLHKYGIDKICVYEDYKYLYENSKIRKPCDIGYRENTNAIKSIFGDVALGHSINLTQLEELVDNVISDILIRNDLKPYLTSIREIDEYTYTHCINVAALSVLTAKWLNYNDERLLELAQAAILHDLGKVKIPKEVLNKPGKLTFEEFEIMKMHSFYGYEIINKQGSLNARIAETILQHHERHDGTGYPHKLIDDQIVEHARIISICDVYDAMTADRVYRKKICPLKVLKMICNNEVGIFNDMIKNIFIKNIIVYFIGENVRFDDGRIGKIVYVDNSLPYELIIRVGDEIIKSGLHTKDDFVLV